MADNVRFQKDSVNKNNTIMSLSTITSNNLSDRSFSRIETPTFDFLDGTYFTRMKYDNNPEHTKDGNIQTFYVIKNAPSNDPEHAECDFEYLAYDLWGEGDLSNGLHMTTYEKYIEAPWAAYAGSTVIKDDFSEWHDYAFIIMGDSVTYHIDGVKVGTHRVCTLDSTMSCYPDNKMQLCFANWIFSSGTWAPLGPSPDERECIMYVDWVYHKQNEYIDPREANKLIDSLRSQSVERINTIK